MGTADLTRRLRRFAPEGFAVPLPTTDQMLDAQLAFAQTLWSARVALRSDVRLGDTPFHASEE